MNNKDPKDKVSIDNLLNEAKTLHRSMSATENLPPVEQSYSKILKDADESVRSLTEGAKSVKNKFLNLREISLGIYEKLVEPIYRIVKPPLAFVWHIYERIWNKYAYIHDIKSGTKVISRTRSTILVLVFISFISIFTPTTLGDKVRFFTTEPIIDTFAILLTKKEETFYLNHSEEIDPARNIHAVRGCKLRGTCTEKDAVYFRVKPRLSHDFWKLINYSNPIYIPDHVVAPIAPGVNECQVTYYGYRMTSSWISRLMRSLEFYPIMLEANCVFVGAQNNLSHVED